MHFSITAFANGNSSDRTTPVTTELWKGYNVCTKIWTTFTLNNTVTLTLAAEFSHGVNSYNPLICLKAAFGQYLCEKRAFYTILSILCFHTCLGIFSPKHRAFWASTYSSTMPSYSDIQCPSDIQQRLCSTSFKQEYRIKWMQTKYFQASVQLRECWVLQATVIVMLTAAMVTLLQGVSRQILGFLVLFFP